MMSEYQYYEFLAIDHPLTKEQMAALSQYSTRASITPTHFINEYHWGDFRGDVYHFLEKYFDAVVYIASWGTRRIALAMPMDDADLAQLRRYGANECVRIVRRGGRCIVDFSADDEEAYGTLDVEPASWMASMIPLRQELQEGDVRALYIAWLRAVMQGYVKEQAIAPPTPPCMTTPTAAQNSLMAFLEVDPDLLDAASESSEPLKELKLDTNWLHALPAAEKDRMLLDVMNGRAMPVRAELRRLQARAIPRAPEPAANDCRVSDLLGRARAICQEREEAEAKQRAKVMARQQAEAEALRVKHLSQLAADLDGAWRKVEAYIHERKQKPYKQAVALLADLAELARRQHQPDPFNDRLAQLHDRHATKHSLMKLLSDAGVALIDD